MFSDLICLINGGMRGWMGDSVPCSSTCPRSGVIERVLFTVRKAGLGDMLRLERVPDFDNM